MTAIGPELCPRDTPGILEVSESISGVMFGDTELREHMMHWYINSGFRGCLFNKLAARDALNGSFEWLTPVEYGTVEEIVDGPAGERVLEVLDGVLNDTDKQGLVSFIFPNLRQAEDYARLLTFLTTQDQDRYKILPVQDRSTLGPDGIEGEFVGVQFRIKLGETDSGEDILSYPMIYTPDEYTTFARRYDHFMIVFNRHVEKNNPETPETYIGVDDIDLGLRQQLFDKLFARSVEVNQDAHSIEGSSSEGEQYSRRLFRAHNALVLPAIVWDEYGVSL